MCHNVREVSARAVAVLFLLATLPAYAAEATGFVREQGCGHFDGVRLQLERIEGKKLTTPIALNIPQSYYWDIMATTVRDWSNVTAPACSSQSCEPAARGKIRLSRVERRFSLWRRRRVISGISGEFVVELQGGRRLEGAFRARVRKPAARIICE